MQRIHLSGSRVKPVEVNVSHMEAQAQARSGRSEPHLVTHRTRGSMLQCVKQSKSWGRVEARQSALDRQQQLTKTISAFPGLTMMYLNDPQSHQYRLTSPQNDRDGTKNPQALSSRGGGDVLRASTICIPWSSGRVGDIQ